jgi:hypothetical protein
MSQHKVQRFVALLGGVVLATGLQVATLTNAASAATTLTLTVNSTVDAPDAHPGDGICADTAGQCTIRAAVQESDAQPAGTVTSVSVPSGTYALSLGPLPVSKNTLRITGAGPTATVVENAKKVNGDLVNVAVKSSATISDLELTGGRAGPAGGGAVVNAGVTTLHAVVVTKNTSLSGGGLTNAKGATLSLVGSTVSNNSAASAKANSAAGGSGGGILNAGQLQLTRSTVSGNLAGQGGFGSSNPGGHGGNGGGISNTGTVLIGSSTISGNQAGTGGIGLSGNEPSGPGGNGGGIASASGSVTLQSAVISGNTSGYSGPLGESPYPNAGNGGGVWSAGTLQVTGGTFSSNKGATGGAAGASGGAIYSSGKATITSSTFTGNVAGQGGSVGGSGGAIANAGTLSLSGSTASNNTAGMGGGSANGGAGGGLFTSAGLVTLTGDTFDADISGTGGNAIPVDPGCTSPGTGGDGGAIFSSATLAVTDTTLSKNATGQGGFDSPPCAGQAPNGVGAGLAMGGGAASLSYTTVADNSDGIDNLGGSVTLLGTIVADSASTNCTGTISEGSGYNLDSGTTCRLAAATDITGAEPMLGILAGNGGPTQTQALLAGSPAIDHGGTATVGCPSTDQRGVARPDEAGDNGNCDMGAYESQGVA